MGKTSKALSSLLCAAILFTGFTPSTVLADADSAFSNLKSQYPTGYAEFMNHGLTDTELKSFLNSLINKLASDTMVTDSNFDAKLISAAKKVANQKVKDALEGMLSAEDSIGILIGIVPPALEPVRDVVKAEWSQAGSQNGGGAGGPGAPAPQPITQRDDGTVVVALANTDQAQEPLKLKYTASVTGFEVQFPAEFISKGQANKQSFSLQIEGLGHLSVPFAKWPNRAVTLEIRPLAKNEVSPAMNRNHLSLVSTPISIGMYELVNGQKVSTDWVGATYAETRITLPSNVAVEKLGAYRIDSATNRISPIPLTTEANNVAVIHHQGAETIVLGEKTDLGSFSDLQTHWAKDSIERLTNKNIVSGYPDGSFEPEQTVTRAELVAMLTRALGLSANHGNGAESFTDVVHSDWYSDAVQTAVSANLVSGDGFGHFRPNDPVNREEAAVIVGRALSYLSDRLPNSQGQGKPAFADHSSISPWAVSSLAQAFQYKIVNGYEDDTFRPGNSTTRAEAGTMIAKLLRVAELMN